MELAVIHWQGLLIWAMVVMQLVPGQAGWVLVQAQVLGGGLVLVQEGQVVVGKENLRAQDYNMMPLLRDLIPHESEALACRDAVGVW
jgi:hypothetical protein